MSSERAKFDQDEMLSMFQPANYIAYRHRLAGVGKLEVLGAAVLRLIFEIFFVVLLIAWLRYLIDMRSRGHDERVQKAFSSVLGQSQMSSALFYGSLLVCTLLFVGLAARGYMVMKRAKAAAESGADVEDKGPVDRIDWILAVISPGTAIAIHSDSRSASSYASQFFNLGVVLLFGGVIMTRVERGLLEYFLTTYFDSAEQGKTALAVTGIVSMLVSMLGAAILVGMKVSREKAVAAKDHA